jgi:hypothetical protein
MLVRKKMVNKIKHFSEKDSNINYNGEFDCIDDSIVKNTAMLLNGNFCGLNIGLINSKKRNIFYDKLLIKTEGKKCIDVGSGSGILALLALKHGAKHVVCFESDVLVCKVLEDMVISCKLSDKIQVINKKFKSSHIKEYNLDDYELIFHELFGPSIWDDYGWPIRSTFDTPISIPITPNRCIVDFYIMEIENLNDSPYINDLVNKTAEIPKFDPGVEISQKFIDYYNYVIEYNNNNNINLNYVFTKIDLSKIENEYKNKLLKKSKKYCRYCFDLNRSDYSEKYIKIELPKLNNPFILLPIYKIGDDEIEGNLNDIFSFTKYLTLLIFPSPDKIIFELNMLNGTIKINDLVFVNGVSSWHD